ncbi:hypothetical protein OSCI_4130005 [Kamptonema sp. PCC 6506]|nr:hypothetical protein OSCI_4130005 [Kamptonema sp. PCC 6506]
MVFDSILESSELIYNSNRTLTQTFKHPIDRVLFFRTQKIFCQ